MMYNNPLSPLSPLSTHSSSYHRDSTASPHSNSNVRTHDEIQYHLSQQSELCKQMAPVITNILLQYPAGLTINALGTFYLKQTGRSLKQECRSVPLYADGHRVKPLELIQALANIHVDGNGLVRFNEGNNNTTTPNTGVSSSYSFDSASDSTNLPTRSQSNEFSDDEYYNTLKNIPDDVAQILLEIVATNGCLSVGQLGRRYNRRTGRKLADIGRLYFGSRGKFRVIRLISAIPGLVVHHGQNNDDGEAMVTLDNNQQQPLDKNNHRRHNNNVSPNHHNGNGSDYSSTLTAPPPPPQQQQQQPPPSSSPSPEKYLTFTPQHRAVYSSYPTQSSSSSSTNFDLGSVPFHLNDNNNQCNDDIAAFVSIFPSDISASIEQLVFDGQKFLIDVILDLNRCPLARYFSPFLRSLSSVRSVRHWNTVKLLERRVTADDINTILTHTKPNGKYHCTGIDNTLHKLSGVCNRFGDYVGITAKVGRVVRGISQLVEDFMISDMKQSLLFIGISGIGTTTTLRDIALKISEQSSSSSQLAPNVVIIDTYNEIGGFNDIVHESVGTARRIQVPETCTQASIILESAINHHPDVMIIDTIENDADVRSINQVVQRGIQVFAGVHGRNLLQIKHNQRLRGLLHIFNVAVEIQATDNWLIHSDLNRNLRAISKGNPYQAERRWMGRDDFGHFISLRSRLEIINSSTNSEDEYV